jgi:carbonic anhydrase/acetyltransferase-like protein (isoleucine patch superfamily)
VLHVLWFNAVIRGCSFYLDRKQSKHTRWRVIHYPIKTSNCNRYNVSIGHTIVHGCTIHDNVLIGMGAIVMDNCVIESNSIVAAGAVITQNSRI